MLDALSEYLLPGVAGDRGEGPVDVQDSLIRVRDHHAFRRVLEDLGVLLEFFLRLLPAGHVETEDVDVSHFRDRDEVQKQRLEADLHLPLSALFSAARASRTVSFHSAAPVAAGSYSSA